MRAAVQCGRLSARISKPRPQSLSAGRRSRAAPRAGRGTARCAARCRVARVQQPGRREQLGRAAGEIGDRGHAVAGGRAGQRRPSPSAAAGTPPRPGSSANVDLGGAVDERGRSARSRRWSRSAGCRPARRAPSAFRGQPDGVAPSRWPQRSAVPAAAAAIGRRSARADPAPFLHRHQAASAVSGLVTEASGNGIDRPAGGGQHAGRSDHRGGAVRTGQPASWSSALIGQRRPGARAISRAAPAARPSAGPSTANQRRSSDSSLITGSAPGRRPADELHVEVPGRDAQRAGDRVHVQVERHRVQRDAGDPALLGGLAQRRPPAPTGRRPRCGRRAAARHRPGDAG